MDKFTLNKVANLLTKMQETRNELLAGDIDDIILGQSIEKGKRIIDKKFTEMTLLVEKKNGKNTGGNFSED